LREKNGTNSFLELGKEQLQQIKNTFEEILHNKRDY
jgi:hypothetical protein